jgi:hypothetical protein
LELFETVEMDMRKEYPRTLTTCERKKILLTFFKEFFSKYRKRPESKEGVP